MMPVVYIAGKFRGANAWQIENNVRRAEEMALDVCKLGVSPLCPHANTRFFHGALPDQFFLDSTLALLAKCDACIMLPDWDASAGARIERAWAMEHGIPVFYSLAELQAWLTAGSASSSSSA